MTTAAVPPERPPSPGPPSGLRRRAARGAIINSAFLIGFALLGLVQRLAVARLLTPAQFGLWNLVLIAILTLLFLKNAGIGDKFVQQDDADQELAFQYAFTLDLLLAVACVVLTAIALPLFALIYGNTGVIAPGLVLSFAVVGNSLQAPVWIHYREMEYGRQRLVMALDPLGAFVVTVTLAAAGAGVWSLVLGAVAGAFLAGIAALVLCPYRLRLRLDRGTALSYAHFSGPMVVASGAGMFIAQVLQAAATRVSGLRGTGAVGLGVSISGFSDGVDGIITQTLYPAICRVVDRRDVLQEAFVKSNRLALLWGMPFGVGVAVFAPGIVHYIVGTKWTFAIHVIQAFGIVAAIDQLGFNWTAFLRALNLTRPMARLAGIQVAVFLLVTMPLFVIFGLNGLSVGWIALGLATVASRAVYLRRLFPDFRMLSHAARASVPTLIAAGIVLALRVTFVSDAHLAGFGTEVVVYVVTIIAISAYIERVLLREAMAYVARRPSGVATA